MSSEECLEPKKPGPLKTGPAAKAIGTLDIPVINAPVGIRLNRAPSKPVYAIPHDYLKRHAYAERMEIAISGKDVANVGFRGKRGDIAATAGDLITVHDIVVVDGEDGKASVKLRNGSFQWQLALPANVELTYPDLLRLAYEQNREKMSELVAKRPEAQRRFAHTDPELDIFLARGFLEEESRLKKSRNDQHVGQKQTVKAWLTDFWLFSFVTCCARRHGKRPWKPSQNLNDRYRPFAAASSPAFWSCCPSLSPTW